MWDQATLAEHSVDPRKFLQTYLDDSGAKSRMSFKLRKGSEDVAAYLYQIAPPAPADS